jgi:tRNA modification GTPase
MYQKDTIVALATPPGIGAIAVIRLSGAQAFEIANQCFYNIKNQQSIINPKIAYPFIWEN